MAPRGHQFPRWNLQKCHHDGQCSKIQYHNLPAGVDSQMDVRGGIQLEEHRGGGHLPGASEAAHPMSRLRGGFDGRFYDGLSHTIEWDIDGN